MIPDLPWTMWAYLLMFSLPWAVIFAALAWASGSGGEVKSSPTPIPRQTTATGKWLDRYRELVAHRGGASRLIAEDLAELARGLRGVPGEELKA